jgi:broad-specificity NMP kinase
MQNLENTHNNMDSQSIKIDNSKNNGRQTYVINIIGGPGIGKTTISALLFANLKIRGYICEYVQEFAKKLVWLKDYDTLNNQFFVSREQYTLLKQIDGHVDFLITDGPLIHGIYYNKYNKDNNSNIDKVEKFILNSINKFKNINIVLDRVDRDYEKEGRIQTEQEAKDIDVILRHILRTNNYTFSSFRAEPDEIENIVNEVIKITNTHN